MAEPHLDYPGEVSWFAGHGPAPVLGECDHACEHRDTRVVAWGPDFRHYELVQCAEKAGCNLQCRGWRNQDPSSNAFSLHGFRRIDAAREADALSVFA